MHLQTVSRIFNVNGSYGSGSGGNVCDVAGAAEAAVQRVLHDGHGIESYHSCFHLKILLDGRAAELGCAGIDKRDVSCPAGTGVAYETSKN